MWGKYFEWAKVNKKSWEEEYYNYHKHIQPKFGSRTLNKITPYDIEKMILELKQALNGKTGRPYAAQTVKHQIVLVRRLFNIAINWDLYSGINPASGNKIKMPKVDNTITEMLTVEQLANLLTILNTYPQYQSANLIKLLLFTGVRRGEAFKLKWDDINFEKRYILLRDPKGGKAHTIPLNKHGLELLKNQPRIEESPYVFPGKDGRKRVSIRRVWGHIKELAGLPKNFRLHGLRHAYASFLASAGVDLYVLQGLMTHKSSTMTQRYAHLTEKRFRNASEMLDKIIEDAIRSKGSNKSDNLRD